MRVAIYARVSTDDKDQSPENQLRQLREWCDTNGHTIACEYVEHISGGKSMAERGELARLFEAAERKEFDCVLVWSIDRLSREGMVETVTYLDRLTKLAIGFRSLTEEHLNHDNELVRNVLVALLSSTAKVERQKISARTKAGMARVKAENPDKHMGRPRLGLDLRRAIRERSARGEGTLDLAERLGLSPTTIRRYR